MRGDNNMVEFYAAITVSPSHIKKMVELLKKHEPKKWAFENVIFTPLMASIGTILEIKQLKVRYDSKIIFDSGGFYVQQNRLDMGKLIDKLKEFYENNKWGDWYVLPDSPPVSSDSVDIAWGKVYETVYFAKSFAEEFNGKMEKKFVPVVQGINEKQIYYCIKNYANFNVKRIGFGSFGTCGKNNQINRLTKESLKKLKYVRMLANEYGFELHAFGIGGGSSANKIKDYVDSFDSSGWDKAAGFGDIFFPNSRTINITGKKQTHHQIDYKYIEQLTKSHKCYFCKKIDNLKKYRIYRSLHNILVIYDMIKSTA